MAKNYTVTDAVDEIYRVTAIRVPAEDIYDINNGVFVKGFLFKAPVPLTLGLMSEMAISPEFNAILSRRSENAWNCIWEYGTPKKRIYHMKRVGDQQTLVGVIFFRERSRQ